MTRQALSGHALLSRCRAWLHRLVDDAAYDEWELDTEPTSPDPDGKKSPQDLIDEVLRDAEDHGPRPDGEGGDHTAQST
jgi:hypothetical protein